MALPNPDLWYKFEDDLLDSSGNGNHGFKIGTDDLQWSDMDTQGVGRAVGPQPDTGTYTPCVGTAYPGWLGYGKIWTCNIWVKTHVVDYPNTSYYICAFGDYYNAGIFQVVYVSTNQRIFVNTYNISTYMTDVLPKLSEVMLTYRYNGNEGASSTIDCFVNGQYYITHNIGERLVFFYDDYHCIVGGENGHPLFLSGTLVGDFRVYESALTNGDISDLYGLYGPPPEILVGNTIVGGLTTN